MRACGVGGGRRWQCSGRVDGGAVQCRRGDGGRMQPGGDGDGEGEGEGDGDADVIDSSRSLEV